MTQKKRIEKLEATHSSSMYVCIEKRLVEQVDEETRLLGILVDEADFMKQVDETDHELYARAKKAIATMKGAKTVLILPEYVSML